ELQVVGGPNESQNMAIVNGSTTVSISIGYDLMAAREGEYVIPPASITVNGKKLTSNSVVVRVVKGRSVPQASAAPRQNVGGPTAADTRDVGKSVFIKAIVDKANVYQGEQLTVTYKLFTKFQITGNQPVKLPELNGFWGEDVTLPAQQL